MSRKCAAAANAMPPCSDDHLLRGVACRTCTRSARKRGVLVPLNEHGLAAGYYSRNGLVRLLREHRNNPTTVRFIADMMEV